MRDSDRDSGPITLKDIPRFTRELLVILFIVLCLLGMRYPEAPIRVQYWSIDGFWVRFDYYGYLLTRYIETTGEIPEGTYMYKELLNLLRTDEENRLDPDGDAGVLTFVKENYNESPLLEEIRSTFEQEFVENKKNEFRVLQFAIKKSRDFPGCVWLGADCKGIDEGNNPYSDYSRLLLLLAEGHFVKDVDELPFEGGYAVLIKPQGAE